MNPVIVIPTYITSRHHREGTSLMSTYDHVTALTEEGELGRCLASIQQAQGNVPVIILVASEPSIDKQAADKVQMIVSKYPDIQALIIGAPEETLVHQRLEQLGMSDAIKGVSLTGYSCVRNMGIAVATIFGFDAVVFIDDDEVVEDPDFLQKAVYGLGKLTKRGVPIVAKSGYFIDQDGSYLSAQKDDFSNKFWEQGKVFNQWISRAMESPRLSRSNHVCGGCLALHKEVFRRLSFDPWITRGEDLDYLLNLRMYGSDMWFDNQWCLRHLPPETTSEGLRFQQDVYRWLYEMRKLEYSRTQIDLLQVKPASLEPYPGPFLTPGVRKRISATAKLRGMASADGKAYRQAAKVAKTDAEDYAAMNCAKYFEFQYIWPQMMDRIENDAVLRTALVQSTALRKGIDLRVQLSPAPVQEQTPEPAPAESAPVFVPKSFDPGATCEIRLNLEDDDLD